MPPEVLLAHNRIPPQVATDRLCLCSLLASAAPPSSVRLTRRLRSLYTAPVPLITGTERKKTFRTPMAVLGGIPEGTWTNNTSGRHLRRGRISTNIGRDHTSGRRRGGGASVSLHSVGVVHCVRGFMGRGSFAFRRLWLAVGSIVIPG